MASIKRPRFALRPSSLRSPLGTSHRTGAMFPYRAGYNGHPRCNAPVRHRGRRPRDSLFEPVEKNPMFPCHRAEMPAFLCSPAIYDRSGLRGDLLEGPPLSLSAATLDLVSTRVRRVWIKGHAAAAMNRLPGNGRRYFI